MLHGVVVYLSNSLKTRQLCKEWCPFNTSMWQVSCMYVNVIMHCFMFVKNLTLQLHWRRTVLLLHRGTGEIGIQAALNRQVGKSPVRPAKSLAWQSSHHVHVDVSKNWGTSKSSILMGFSIINHPFWGTSIFGNTHVQVPSISNMKQCISHTTWKSNTEHSRQSQGLTGGYTLVGPSHATRQVNHEAPPSGTQGTRIERRCPLQLNDDGPQASNDHPAWSVWNKWTQS